jgi:hypothetical protein
LNQLLKSGLSAFIKENDQERLKEELGIVLKKWTTYMLKKTKEKNEKTYKLKDITMSPFVFDGFQVTQENLNPQIVLAVNLKEDPHGNLLTFLKSFSGSLVEIFRKAIRSKWINENSKWFQILNIDTNICY